MRTSAPCVVTLHGDYDVYRTPELDLELRGTDGMRHVVIDFSAVRYISSSTIGALIRMRKRRSAADLPLVKFAALSPTLRRILQFVALDQAWPWYDDVTDALRSFDTDLIKRNGVS